jgi:ergot alkaloid biosynthesis protein
MSGRPLARMTRVDRVLVTGGTGKTGRRVAEQLAGRGADARVATRFPRSAGEVRFDWGDPGSHDGALEGVSAIYMVAPANDLDPLPSMIPFMARAVARGMGPLVLLSASSLEPGGPMMGAVHQWLMDNAPRWTVLRPTWFMQNFSEQQHLRTILDEGVIYSATGDGRVGFIDADDIARVAVEALVGDALINRDVVLTGPEALRYDDVAALISDAAERRIDHRRLGVREMAARLEASGLPPGYADILASMDEAIAQGSEDGVTAEVEHATGHPPRSFRHFAQGSASAWR